MKTRVRPFSDFGFAAACLSCAALLPTACVQPDLGDQARHRTEGEAIHFAVRNGNMRQLSHLLETGADPDFRDASTLQTPLATAVLAGGDKEQIALLLRAGADPNLTDSVGNTALHIAAQTNQPWVALQLLEAGVRPGKRNDQGKTFLAYFALVPDNRLSPDARAGKKAVMDWLTRAGYAHDNGG